MEFHTGEITQLQHTYCIYISVWRHSEREDIYWVTCEHAL